MDALTATEQIIERALRLARDGDKPRATWRYLCAAAGCSRRRLRKAIQRLRLHYGADCIDSRTTDGGGYMWCETRDERRRAGQALGRRLRTHAKTYHSKRGDGQQQLALTEED